MSIFQELKRRNVVRMALLYGVASWLILQVADVLFSAMDLPLTWVRLVLALLVLGFPLVLILSWVYEMTPEGLKRESEVRPGESITTKTGRKIDLLIAVLLVLAIVAIGADRFIPQEPDVAEATQAAANLQEEISSSSIAVLPFANRSAQADDAYFVDGMHDDILTQLARIGSLTVTSRTSVEQFRDTTMGIPEIGEILGVRNILEGGVQRAGDRVRINLQLIDVRNDDHLWAETFETELTASNVFKVQGDIARAVTDALSAALRPEEEAALLQKPTNSIEAYELYLLGRFHTYKRTAESIELAKSYFEQAIEQDPHYVLALSGLSDAYVLLEGYGNLSGDVAYPQAQAAIDKAMALDDSVSEVWASLGLLRHNTLDLPGAEQALIRALELDESNFSAWHWYGRLLWVMRRFDESLEALQKAYALEPMSLVINNSIAITYNRFGEFPLARFHRERAAQIRPDQRILRQLEIANDHFEGGNFAAAIALTRRILAEDPRNARALEFTATSYLVMGDVAEASSWFSRLGSVDSTSWTRYRLYIAEEDYQGAVVFVEDTIESGFGVRYPFVVGWMFQASHRGGNLQQAADYLSEQLELLNGRIEIEPSLIDQSDNLRAANFMIEHGEAFDFDTARGYEMLDEIEAGLSSLVEQGSVHPFTLVGLAAAKAMKGDMLAAQSLLDSAVDNGFLNQGFMLDYSPFDVIRHEVFFENIVDRISEKHRDDADRLDEMSLPAYEVPTDRVPVSISREKLQTYVGYYSNGNALADTTVAEGGGLTIKIGSLDAFSLLALGDGSFFTPKDTSMTLQFFEDDGGEVTHLIARISGNEMRFKSIAPPPDPVDLSREQLMRFEGTYAYDMPRQGGEGVVERDQWVGVIEVAADGSLWIDLDDQPKLKLLPISETSLRIPGFETLFEFRFERDSTQAIGFTNRSAGRVIEFYRID